MSEKFARVCGRGREKTAEAQRLIDSHKRVADWKNWGPYLSERAWGTVREDYSSNGDAWSYFPYEHAPSRAYRWNEDGIAGVCNRHQNLCLGLSLWNENDSLVKERLFGLTGAEGNHGEDVKEYYFYLDNTPTHSYMKYLYKYPQTRFPFERLREENMKMGKVPGEFELLDTGIFEKNKYFDVFIEYAKADQEDILIKITAHNRGPEKAPIHILPQIWARNTWSWGYSDYRPEIKYLSYSEATKTHTIRVTEKHLGTRYWYIQGDANLNVMFTENDTNYQKLYGGHNKTPYVKDSICDAILTQNPSLVNPERQGTKAAAHFHTHIESGGSYQVRARFSPLELKDPFGEFDQVYKQKIQEADTFYSFLQPPGITEEEIMIQRQALSGVLWNKQYYHLGVEIWKQGDPDQPSPPQGHGATRNVHWQHFYANDVITMPDKWEYPWFAAWDLAFHCVPIAMVDPEWAKRQLVLMLREWYMHPSGQIPAYEWNFSDVNPPVHAWATLQVYRYTEKILGKKDLVFLEKIFQKLLLNFTWWVNRKDQAGNNIFEGGFLGLDNIGVFDRSAPLPTGGYLQQADGTAWMGMYCLNMLAMALEIAMERPAYEDIATKFLEHFIHIASSVATMGDNGLWNEEEGFFFDAIHQPNGASMQMKVHSFVGLIPLFAVELLEESQLSKLPSFRARFEWLIKYRPNLLVNTASFTTPGIHNRRLLSLVSKEKLERVLKEMLDPNGFLSDCGLRSLSKHHLEKPYHFQFANFDTTVKYEPAESSTSMFGGNSNWRGPIWFPVNYLMIKSLQIYYGYYGDSLKVELPTGSGNFVDLNGVAEELSSRLIKIFAKGEGGERPVFNGNQYFNKDEHWNHYIPFYEYFHGDSGAGLGASHQTGWTGLVASLIEEFGMRKLSKLQGGPL
eukprot:Phypoly_transcript_02391.p1 GENE.Phypoly_transcript_02391~~Phypoly_transcript_02391.p1  ORF type:complete len:914 (-),score=147.31 Phypoly_transcript_02391:97-2814(-)